MRAPGQARWSLPRPHHTALIHAVHGLKVAERSGCLAGVLVASRGGDVLLNALSWLLWWTGAVRAVGCLHAPGVAWSGQ